MGKTLGGPGTDDVVNSRNDLFTCTFIGRLGARASPPRSGLGAAISRVGSASTLPYSPGGGFYPGLSNLYGSRGGRYPELPI